MLHGPGKVEFKASMKELAGAASSSFGFNLPVPTELHLNPTNEPHSLRFAALGTDDLIGFAGWEGKPFWIRDIDGKTMAEGTVSEDGRLPRVTSSHAKSLKLRLGDPNGAELIACAKDVIKPPPIISDDDDDTEDDGVDTADDNKKVNVANKNVESQVISSRYFQEVVAAVSHHHSEFLTESAVAELINNANTN